MAELTFEALASMKPKQLEEILRAQEAPSFDSLAGWEFRGWNVVAPIGKPFASVLGIQRFAKGFYRRDGRALGYNVDIARGGLSEPWRGKPSDEAPRRRAFYVVTPPGEGARVTDAYPNALYLDYTARKDKNGLFDGGPLFGDGGLKDFVVQASPDTPDLLVGKAYYRLPPLTVVGGFFVAERWRRFDFREDA